MLAALEGETTYKGSGNWTYKYYDLQGPQAIRLFNQYPLVVTGFLDLHTFRRGIVAGKRVRTYTKLNVSDGTLGKWLRRVNTIPPLPSMGDAHDDFIKVGGFASNHASQLTGNPGKVL